MKITDVTAALANSEELKEVYGSLTRAQHEALISIIVKVMDGERYETKRVFLERLRFLARARGEYVGKEPQSQLDIERMSLVEKIVWAEAHAADQLANILDGRLDPVGWLPSWHREAWKRMT